MIDRNHALPLSHQAKILGLSRGCIYYQPVIPSINSSPLKNLGFSDTPRVDEFFDHTGIFTSAGIMLSGVIWFSLLA